MKLQKDAAHGTWDYPFEVHHTILKGGLYLYPHLHNEFEITVITKGEGIFCVDSQDYPVKKGDILIVPSNSIHLASKTIDCDASFFSIVFDTDYFFSSHNSRIFTKYVKPVKERQVVFPVLITTDADWYDELLSLSLNIEKLYGPEENELLCQSEIIKIWDLLFKHSLPSGERKTLDSQGARLKESIDFMHKNFEKHITVEMLSNISHISEGHFSRLFKEYMKMSPMEYLIHIRVIESARQLRETDASIGEIALACGFNDFSYYGKCFKKQMGIPPLKYRKDSQRK